MAYETEVDAIIADLVAVDQNSFDRDNQILDIIDVKVAALESVDSAQQVEIDALKSQVALLDPSDREARLAVIEGWISGLDTDADGKIEGLETLISAVGALDGRVGVVEGKVSSLETKDAVQDSKIASLEQNQTTILATQQNHGTRLATNETEIANLKNALDNIEFPEDIYRTDEEIKAIADVATDALRADVAGAFARAGSAFTAISASLVGGRFVKEPAIPTGGEAPSGAPV